MVGEAGKHVFDPATRICACGTTMTQAAEGMKVICPIDRTPPAGSRATPRSFDADPADIGERLRQIQAQESRNVP